MAEEKILVIEDDQDIAGLIQIHLEDEGYKVEHEADGREGLQRALQDDYVLIILDIMLPGMDGRDICRQIRKRDERIPILMLSLKSDVMDKVLGLEEGADDYMTKPFKIQELVARVKVLRRRIEAASGDAKEDDEGIIKVGDVVIDRHKRRVNIEGQDVELTPKEFGLLSFLAERPGRAFSREELLNNVWGYDSAGYEHTVDTHVNRLRAKIEGDPSKPKYILTVWGVGYRFNDEY